MGGINTGDTAFVLICAALVALMTPGLAFFYGGLVRSNDEHQHDGLDLVEHGEKGYHVLIEATAILHSQHS